VLVHDGVAYCSGGFFPDEGGSIYALDAATGKVRWVKTDFFNRWPVDSIRGPMTMTGEVLFLPTVGGPPVGVHVNEPSRRTYHNLNWLGAFSPTGCVMAVEGEDRPEVVVSGSATLQFIHHATTYNDERRVLPIVTDTAIYLRDGRRLTADRREAYRVHKKNGVFTWSGGPRLQKARPSPKADDVLWKALKVIDPRCIIQAGGAVLTGTAGGRVYAHDATSGRELWVKEMGGPVADLAFAGGRLVVITDNGRIVCLSGP